VGRSKDRPTHHLTPIQQNHDRLMTDFGRGWVKASGATLVAVRNEVVRPGTPGFYEMPAAARPA